MSVVIQDQYPESYSQCYGCGRLNDEGLQIKSHFDGELAVCRFLPRPEYRAIKGIVYGGLLASLVDCHATGTAAAAATLDQHDSITPDTVRRFVTAHLEVDYLAPTPAGVELELRARPTEVGARKVAVEIELWAGETMTVKGQAVCVEAPASLFD